MEGACAVILEDFLAGIDFPDAHGVLYRKRQPLPIVAKTDRPGIAVLSLERLKLGAIGRIPDPNSPIPSGRCQLLSIGGEGNRVDRALMLSQNKRFGIEVVEVPNLGLAIRSRAGQMGAIGTIGQ